MRIGAFLLALLRRLLRRPGFLAVLALIPALTLVYSAAARQEAGMVTVALAREDAADALAGDIIQALPENSEVLRYIPCETPEAAIELVKTGKADCAWVFQADTLQNIRKFIRTRSSRDAFITAYQREETVLLRLSRERLNAQVYTAIARELYVNTLTDESAALAAMPREELLRFWEQAEIPGTLFSYTQAGQAAKPVNYLLSPLRGLLAVVVLLGSLSQGMYHSRDEEAGTFGYLPCGVRWLPEFAGGLLSALVLCCGVGLALGLAGVAGNIWQEMPRLGALALGCASFSMAVRRLLPNMGAMAAVLPVVVVLGLTACPVFLNIEALAPAGAVLPVFHYLTKPLWLIPYSAVCFAIAMIPRKASR